MEIPITVNKNIDPEILGEIIADSTPDEFAKIWLSFASKLQGEKGKIQEFGKVLAPNMGASRRIAFEKIYLFMKYYQARAE